MKKIFKVLTCLVLSLNLLASGLIAPSSVSASTKTVSQETITLENGDHCVVTTTETTAETPNGIALYATKTKSAEKSYSYYNSSNTLCWVYTLHGTFMYDNSTLVVCSDTYHEIAIHHPDKWIYESGKHWKQANNAYGKATFRLIGFSATKTANLQISCTKHGVIS